MVWSIVLNAPDPVNRSKSQSGYLRQAELGSFRLGPELVAQLDSTFTADIQEVYRNEGKYPNRGKAFSFFKVMRDRRPDLFSRTTGVLSEEGANWHDFRMKAQQGNYRFGVPGRRSGSSSWASAFCLSEPGSNPGTDLGFFQFRIALNLFLLCVWLFLITCNRMMHRANSFFFFLFPIIIYHRKIYQL